MRLLCNVPIGGFHMTHLESADVAVSAGQLEPATIRERVDGIVPGLTLEEKAALTVGRDFWSTQPVERLGVPSIVLTDGPTGVRQAREGSIGIGDSIPATCFPTASALASPTPRSRITACRSTPAGSPPRMCWISPGRSKTRAPWPARRWSIRRLANSCSR